MNLSHRSCWQLISLGNFIACLCRFRSVKCWPRFKCFSGVAPPCSNYYFFFFWFKSVNALKDKIERFESTLTPTSVSSALDTVRQLSSHPTPLVDLGFGRLCSKKRHIMLLAVPFFLESMPKLCYFLKIMLTVNEIML